MIRTRLDLQPNGVAFKVKQRQYQFRTGAIGCGCLRAFTPCKDHVVHALRLSVSSEIAPGNDESTRESAVRCAQVHAEFDADKAMRSVIHRVEVLAGVNG